MPMFNIVGLPDTAIKESKERVRTAIKNSGYEFPISRITVNLAPASLKKEGSQLDLSIAVGILLSSGVIVNSQIEDTIFIGELSLDGKLNPIEGALAMVISMRELNKFKFIVPYENKDECNVIDGIDIIPIKTLSQLVDYMNGEIIIEPSLASDSQSGEYEYLIDFSEIKGQSGLKRALEIAAAGAHNILIIGPPGAGKTMAARRLPTILPKLTIEESIEVTKIYSISGLLTNNSLMKERPFRSPHHTASSISLIGGGKIPKPGEVTLANNGVLFLDELPEFNKNVLEVLRQPMEDGVVTISRASASLCYPAKFMLVASMNPCNCGYYQSIIHNCTCSQSSIDRYLGKISKPLLDRMDIHIEVMPVEYKDLIIEKEEETSATIRERVNKARVIQHKRFQGTKIFSNSQMLNRDIKKYCKLSTEGQFFLNQAFEKYKFSGRTYNRILKISRTIADLEGSKDIQDEHVLEAIRYRALDDKYWR